jgi:hypothetical protein
MNGMYEFFLDIYSPCHNNLFLNDFLNLECKKRLNNLWKTCSKVVTPLKYLNCQSLCIESNLFSFWKFEFPPFNHFMLKGWYKYGSHKLLCYKSNTKNYDKYSGLWMAIVHIGLLRHLLKSFVLCVKCMFH